MPWCWLAHELLTRGVQAIKADSWGVMYGQAAPQTGAVGRDPPAIGLIWKQQTLPNCHFTR